MKIQSRKVYGKVYRTIEHVPGPTYTHEVADPALKLASYSGWGNYFNLAVGFDERAYTVQLDRQELERLVNSLTNALAASKEEYETRKAKGQF